MKESFKTLVTLPLGALLLASCGSQNSGLAEAADAAPLGNQGSETKAKEAQAKVVDLFFDFDSVYMVGVAECGANWASEALGIPVPEIVERREVGVIVGFSDEAEFLNFARSSIIFGGEVETSQGDVLLCAELGTPPIIEPVAGGSNQ